MEIQERHGNVIEKVVAGGPRAGDREKWGELAKRVRVSKTPRCQPRLPQNLTRWPFWAQPLTGKTMAPRRAAVQGRLFWTEVQCRLCSLEAKADGDLWTSGLQRAPSVKEKRSQAEVCPQPELTGSLGGHLAVPLGARMGFLCLCQPVISCRSASGECFFSE